MTLYSAKRTRPDEIAFTKWDEDLNLLETYSTTASSCSCPAGHRPTCKHRKMIPIFERHGQINGPRFYDYEHRQWKEPLAKELAEYADTQVEALAPPPTTPVDPPTDKLMRRI